ncbi:MAG: hypothetical protein SFV24_23525 [Gemmatimonadales bacterium]|nr:hypothetical protein [Gemmatimonadales bacterium]
MPLQLLVDSIHEITVIHVDGRSALPDWTAALLVIAFHPDRLSTSRIVVDLRRAHQAGMIPLDRQAALARRMLPEPESIRFSILTSVDPNVTGTALALAGALEHAGFDAAAFRDPDSACTWLLDGDELPPMPAPAGRIDGEAWATLDE